MTDQNNWAGPSGPPPTNCAGKHLRCISAAMGEEEISLEAINAELVEVDQTVRAAAARHNVFLKELGLATLPMPE